MKTLKYSILVVAALFFAGCATTPQKAPGSATVGGETKPTYSEKVETQTISNYRGSKPCSLSGGWKSLSWRDQTVLANACVQSERWSQVREIGDHLAVHAPLTPWGAYYLSLEAASRKDYTRATWMLELALKKSPNEGLFHYELGRVQWLQGLESEAKASLIKASDLNASLTQAHVFVAQLALVEKSYSRAEKYLRKALSAEPKNWAALMGMATVLTNKQDWVGAEDYLVRAVKAQPREFQSRWALAGLYEKQLNSPTQALASYKELEQRRLAQAVDHMPDVSVQEKIQSLKNQMAQKNKKVSDRKPTATDSNQKVAQ